LHRDKPGRHRIDFGETRNTHRVQGIGSRAATGPRKLRLIVFAPTRHLPRSQRRADTSVTNINAHSRSSGERNGSRIRMRKIINDGILCRESKLRVAIVSPAANTTIVDTRTRNTRCRADLRDDDAIQSTHSPRSLVDPGIAPRIYRIGRAQLTVLVVTPTPNGSIVEPRAKMMIPGGDLHCARQCVAYDSFIVWIECTTRVRIDCGVSNNIPRIAIAHRRKVCLRVGLLIVREAHAHVVVRARNDNNTGDNEAAQSHHTPFFLATEQHHRHGAPPVFFFEGS
jgi:hypothetical protein